MWNNTLYITLIRSIIIHVHAIIMIVDSHAKVAVSPSCLRKLDMKRTASCDDKKIVK